MMNLTLPKWCDVLIVIYKTPESKRYCQKFTSNVDTTINHIREIVRVLQDAKLVEIKPTKKIKRIELTEKGKEVAQSIQKIKITLNGNQF